MYRPVFGVAKGEADIGGLLRGKVSDTERGRRSPAVRGVVIGTILCMGPVVVERNACDLPAICSGAFHDSILLCLVGVTKGVMAGAFEFSGKIASYTCEGDGFQRVDITKHLDGGRIGFVSDLEGNLSGSGLFNGKTDIVEMIGVSVRFCILAESLRGTFEAAGTEGVQCDHRSPADYFSIGFENVLFSRNIADRDLIVSQVLSGCGHINDPGFGIIDRCTGGERSHGAYHGCG